MISLQCSKSTCEFSSVSVPMMSGSERCSCVYDCSPSALCYTHTYLCSAPPRPHVDYLAIPYHRLLFCSKDCAGKRKKTSICERPVDGMIQRSKFAILHKPGVNFELLHCLILSCKLHLRYSYGRTPIFDIDLGFQVYLGYALGIWTSIYDIHLGHPCGM